ncbi:hypothetical protein C8Q79DRAFT_910527 [Trametes meyenii]|nr:hypothetical protein C8Q79DRAFT_910527 [Trametes meyenii]
MQNGSCNLCPAGTTSVARSSSCISCAAGTYAPEGSATCTPCAAGTYSTTAPDQSTTAKCPASTYTSVPGGSSCTVCPAGSFAPLRGSTQCHSCCSGFCSTGAKSVVGSAACTQCPVSGSYSLVGSTNSSQCLSGVSGGLTLVPPHSRNWRRTPSQAPAYYRRGPHRRTCPNGHQSCPIYGSTLRRRGYLKGYECVDMQNDLESCGGWVANDSPFGKRTQGGGRDCSAIPHIESVVCRRGVCAIGEYKHKRL